ncbi:MAG: DUF2442 domain-containing protein [Methylococcaceae bacterium]
MVLLDIIQVQVLADYVLLLEFENGEHRRFNMTPYLSQRPWQSLKKNALFQSATVDNDTVVWVDNIDIDPETLYEFSELIN